MKKDYELNMRNGWKREAVGDCFKVVDLYSTSDGHDPFCCAPALEEAAKRVRALLDKK